MESKWNVQLRKGTLELAILAALKSRRLYGLEILKLLHCFDSMIITEGTLYPLMDRLKRDGLVIAEWHQEGESKPRKYYQLSIQGGEKLSSLSNLWRESVLDIEFLLDNPGPKPINGRQD